MVLEPPGLEPDHRAGRAIGEIVTYNVLEGLTKINVDGSVTPLLASDGAVDPTGAAIPSAAQGLKFQDGTAFDAAAVKFASTARRPQARPTRPSAECSTTSRRSPRLADTVILT